MLRSHFVERPGQKRLWTPRLARQSDPLSVIGTCLGIDPGDSQGDSKSEHLLPIRLEQVAQTHPGLPGNIREVGGQCGP